MREVVWFLLSCMISLHCLSPGSSSAFLYDQFTRPLTWFLLCFLVWSVYTASHMVPPLLSFMISLHSFSYGSSSAFLYDQCTRPLTWFLCFLVWSVYTASHMVPPLLSCMISLHGLSQYKKAEEPCERPCRLIIQESRGGTIWEAV
jgi:hypothetical protein